MGLYYVGVNASICTVITVKYQFEVFLIYLPDFSSPTVLHGMPAIYALSDGTLQRAVMSLGLGPSEVISDLDD